MRRRDFISFVGGAAAAWPLAARAQQSDRVRRIGVLMAYAEDNPDGKPRLAAFAKGLQELGWIDGRNIRIEYRWSAGDAERTRNMLLNWLRSHPMSFWPVTPPPWGHCNRQLTQCQLYSQAWLIRSVPVSSTALHAREETLPGLRSSNTA
jgi:hypothetical protein